MKLPPIPYHPEPMIMRWSSLEIKAIEEYALAVAEAVKAECAAICESRETPGTGSVAVLRGAADAIKSLEIEP